MKNRSGRSKCRRAATTLAVAVIPGAGGVEDVEVRVPADHLRGGAPALPGQPGRIAAVAFPGRRLGR